MAAAEEWGQLDSVRSKVQERLSAYVQAHTDGFHVPDVLLQERSEEFRRNLGLHTAQVTQQWMDAHGLSIDAFGGFLEREACREHYASASVAIHADAALSEKDVDDVLWSDIVFSGNFQPWCQKLMELVAVACSVNGGNGVDGDISTWPEQLKEYDRLHGQFRTELLSTTRLENALRLKWHDFFLLRCKIGMFDNEASLREAVFCITEDGLSMEKVCAMAKGEFMCQEVLLNQLPLSLQTAALSAAPGSMLPPFEQDGRQVLIYVHKKREPDLADDVTRSVLSETILADTVRPLVREHIQYMGATSQ